ncbi:dihydrofolate reductase family protein [Kitasatospora sp. NPDC049285]|uniref:dihydrofolate reductase family protein n=1 Tax=Kitasatospora sp. NPDC049285 TaxID=3157096 RepID=UPI003414DEF6
MGSAVRGPGDDGGDGTGHGRHRGDALRAADLAGVPRAWAERTDGNPYTEKLNGTPKYVVSGTLEEPLPWQNSVLLTGDAAAAVADLKKELEQDLVVLGSGELVRSLAAAGLVDRFVLSVHPLVLGSGRRLFPDRGPLSRMRLVDSVPTGTGVIIATYETC